MDQGKFYDEQYDDKIYSKIGLPDNKIVDYISGVRNKMILSIGCGMGADVWFLVDKNSVYGIDSSKTAVAIAKRHGIEAVVGDVQKKLNCKERFDIIVLKDILEHVIDPMFLLSEAKRLLKPNGEIVISIPNHFYWWFRLRILFGKNMIWKTLQHDHTKDQDEWNYMHIRFFTYEGLKKMISRAGLKISKGYWDFGTLAHYSDPEMFYQAIYDKPFLSKMAKVFLRVVYPTYKIFDLVFPRKLRAKFVEINPSLLCAGFYLRLKKI